MPDIPMSIKQVIWHKPEPGQPGNGTLEFILQSREPPPPPEWIAADQWYGGAGESIGVSAPVGRKVTTTAPTGIGVTGTNPDGTPVLTRYTYNGTAWVNPVPVDHQGNPL